MSRKIVLGFMSIFLVVLLVVSVSALTYDEKAGKVILTEKELEGFSSAKLTRGVSTLANTKCLQIHGWTDLNQDKKEKLRKEFKNIKTPFVPATQPLEITVDGKPLKIVRYYLVPHKKEDMPKLIEETKNSQIGKIILDDASSEFKPLERGCKLPYEIVGEQKIKEIEEDRESPFQPVIKLYIINPATGEEREVDEEEWNAYAARPELRVEKFFGNYPDLIKVIIDKKTGEEREVTDEEWNKAKKEVRKIKYTGKLGFEGEEYEVPPYTGVDVFIEDKYLFGKNIPWDRFLKSRQIKIVVEYPNDVTETLLAEYNLRDELSKNGIKRVIYSSGKDALEWDLRGSVDNPITKNTFKELKRNSAYFLNRKVGEAPLCTPQGFCYEDFYLMIEEIVRAPTSKDLTEVDIPDPDHMKFIQSLSSVEAIE